ncbi:LPS export ABC transporter permease LptG [Jeongeupia sp. HS-3]|uniref:LPS export ABC transporter permease LptG n=1 Tax=Jeongeupia sp. HS-3 TaxID=1009682 RepID=UPI00190FC206|nr:LPS export ABC transporter permease LptG [Jeongeupia sp. HS-3]
MMKLLSRYLLKELTLFVLFTLVGLLALYMFFDVIAQFSQLGKGGYRVIDALIYVALQIPGNAYELMPIAVLIGSIFALSNLNGNSELTVMRAAGVSVQRLLLWLVGIGVAYSAFTVVLGEYVAPVTMRMASQYRLAATKQMIAGDFHSGVWVKDGRQIVNIAEMLPDLSVQRVRIYEFSEQRTLDRIVDGVQGRYKGNGVWTLAPALQTSFLPASGGVVLKNEALFDWATQITPEMLAVLLVEPAQMSARALMRYIDHLEVNGQKTQRYQLALWGKLFYPLACLSMVVIALPFSQTQRRSANVGVKLFIGILTGVTFHFFNRLVVYLGELQNWPAPAVVSIPTLTFMGAALWLLWRQEKR